MVVTTKRTAVLDGMHHNQWKTLGHGPHVGVIGFAVDNAGLFPVLKRSDKVKSVPNVWSLPSGTHEPGSSFAETFSRECKEELNLDVTDCETVGVYDNIVYEEGWHWVMVLVVGRVTNPRALKNMEPDKHSELELMNLAQFLSKSNREDYSRAMANAVSEFQVQVRRIIRELSLSDRSNYFARPKLPVAHS